MTALGQFIKDKREAVNLSQKELGSKCRISDSAIQRIETGATASPNWDLLCKIAKALDFHVFEVLRIAGYITDADINPAHSIRRLDRLNNDDLNMVQTFIDFLISRRNCSEKRRVV